MPAATTPTTVWTVGHSTHSAGDFLALLRAHDIELVADVRRFRGSRRHPQFGQEALERSLGDAGIAYLAVDALGGRRRLPPGPLQMGWRNTSFRSYAAFTWTDEFADGLAQLLDVAHGLRTAMMCSEVLWWRCHRALVADVLAFQGDEVLHIAGVGAPSPHPYTSAARLLDEELVYPVDEGVPLQAAWRAAASGDACCAPAPFARAVA